MKPTASSPEHGHSSRQQLAFTLASAEQLIHYQLQVMRMKRPEGLLPCCAWKEKGGYQLCLDPEDYLPLTELLTKTSKENLPARVILEQSCLILQEARDRLLPFEQISCSEEWIFLKPADNNTYRLRLCFWPCTHSALKADHLVPDTISAIWPLPPVVCAGEEEWLNRFVNMISQIWKLPAAETECYLNAIAASGLTGLSYCLQQTGDPSGHSAANSPAASHHEPEDTPSVKQREKGRMIRLACCLPPVAGLIMLLKNFNLRYGQAILLAFALTGLLYFLAGLAYVCSRPKWLKQIREIIVASFSRAGHYYRQLLIQLKILGQERQESQSESRLVMDRLNQTQIMPADLSTFRLAVMQRQNMTDDDDTGLERAFIMVEQFIVGRDRNKVDLYLNNAAVGRQHARISRKSGAFFICDLGSKNGTRLNGHLLNKHQEYPLPDNCQLDFAHIRFMFSADLTY